MCMWNCECIVLVVMCGFVVTGIFLFLNASLKKCDVKIPPSLETADCICIGKRRFGYLPPLACIALFVFLSVSKSGFCLLAAFLGFSILR